MNILFSENYTIFLGGVHGLLYIFIFMIYLNQFSSESQLVSSNCYRYSHTLYTTHFNKIGISKFRLMRYIDMSNTFGTFKNTE